VAILVAGTYLTANAALKVGDTLPNLGSYSLEGKLPENCGGKVVIVDFWASWCLPCAASFPVLDELQQKYPQKLVVIAVNVDEKQSNMDGFLKKHAVSFDVLRDAGQKLVAAVEPETMPTSFILDQTGKVRYVHNGFHGESTREEYIQEIESLLSAGAR
jgi:thiol-disulfide isomerase/thioredoxin